jgi:hypothetical protein
MFYYHDIVTRSEFPSLLSQSRSSMMKDHSALNRQKSQAGRLPVPSAATANQSGKGKAEATNKQTGIPKFFYSYSLKTIMFKFLTSVIMQRQWTSEIGWIVNGPSLLEQMVSNCVLLQVRIIQSFVLLLLILIHFPFQM